MSDDKPVIEQRDNGPLVVKNLKSLRLADGTEGKAKPVIVLCRCGASKKKPFCDGSHQEIGFDSAGADVSSRDRVYSYEGKNATVYYNKLLCSHAAECGARAHDIFDPAKKPWVQPDAGSVEQIKEVVSVCPSGALRYSAPGGDAQTLGGDAAAIEIEQNGPLRVTNIDIDAAYWAEGQTKQKYVLCRCGMSKNKPFCDGTHHDEGWDESH